MQRLVYPLKKGKYILNLKLNDGLGAKYSKFERTTIDTVIVSIQELVTDNGRLPVRQIAKFLIVLVDFLIEHRRLFEIPSGANIDYLS